MVIGTSNYEDSEHRWTPLLWSQKSVVNSQIEEGSRPSASRGALTIVNLLKKKSIGCPGGGKCTMVGIDFIYTRGQSENYGLSAKSDLPPVLQIKCYCNTATLILYIPSLAVFVLQLQSWVVVTRLLWSAQLKIFTLWPFIENICWLLIQ